MVTKKIDKKELKKKISISNTNPSKEIREKMRISHLGQIPWNKNKINIYSQKTLNKMSIANSKKHKPCSEETKNKISLANKGINNGMFQKIPWNKNKPHSKEVIQKLKEARKYRVIPFKDTKIEVKIQDFLKQLNIEFYTHYYINIEHGYQCDIFIPKQKKVNQKTIIECDGDWWHGNLNHPRNKILNQKQLEQRKRDKIRTKELEEKGYRVIRLWETEINILTIIKFENFLN